MNMINKDMIDLIWSEDMVSKDIPKPDTIATQEEIDEMKKNIYLDTLMPEDKLYFPYSGTESGTFNEPYNTIAEALTEASSGNPEEGKIIL